MRLSLLWNRRLADDVWRNFPSGKIVLAYRRSCKYTGMAKQRGNDSCFSGNYFSFPGIIFYGIALFCLESLIKPEKTRKIYHYLNVFGLTPWMCLHIFYIMILYLYAWMTNNGYSEAALPACEALFQHLSWVVAASEIMMVPVFIFWFYAVVSGKTFLPKKAAFFNVLVFYVVLKALTVLLPNTAFRSGFTNGLMSESMLLFFVVIWLFSRKIENFKERTLP